MSDKQTQQTNPGTQSKNSLENSVYIQYTYTQTQPEQTDKATDKQTQQQTNKQTTDKQFLENMLLNSTDVLPLRVKTLIKQIYKDMPMSKKKMVNSLLQDIILSMAEEKLPESIKKQLKRELNIEILKHSDNAEMHHNINIIINENRAEVNIDLTKLVDFLNELQKLIFEIAKHNYDNKLNAYVLPKARMNDLTKIVNNLRRLLN
ncbi:hypothetical protein SPV2_gp19 [Sulfolobus polyhedral virus 2]|uniref:Uncharacterized protein n=1 Tax=Sulfolobus polyhedral virus 2 TaxID=2493125 RepID=A0A3Q8Q451_9VIRU|nr:hypothetical protein KM458_gp19 [Sulfolobus polyhedral virus 2]AZI76018.1 hypothetical protein SPV2_gp19 [Sulfolobus polyhedral virus 2]